MLYQEREVKFFTETEENNQMRGPRTGVPYFLWGGTCLLDWHYFCTQCCPLLEGNWSGNCLLGGNLIAVWIAALMRWRYTSYLAGLILLLNSLCYVSRMAFNVSPCSIIITCVIYWILPQIRLQDLRVLFAMLENFLFLSVLSWMGPFTCKRLKLIIRS